MRSETIARQKAQHIQAYTEIIENLVVLNVNDFHNIHESHYSNATSMHDVSYFIMILLKALPEMLSIPVNHPNQEMNVHNEEGRKNAFNDLFRQKTHDERVERLLIHRSLHSTENYVSALKSLINIPKAETYMKTQDLIELIDYLGQLYVLHIVPIIGPLHVSLNSHEIVFLLNYDFFDLLFHAVFGRNKVLAKKPKPYKINLILEIGYQGWSQVRPIWKLGSIYRSNVSQSHNIRYLPKQLEYLEKRTSLFLLNFNVYKNIDIMLMAWNMAHISQNDRFCDFEDCIDSKSSDKKAKTKNSDNSEVIKASGPTNETLLGSTGIIYQKQFLDKNSLQSSDKKAKTKNSDNSEVIKASDDTSDKSFFLDSNVDYSNIDLLVEGAKNTLANM
ncbi:hypothetical protein C2G38_2207452 [Gigaspora rosea]|uniref:Uncharacterized protein n=1 Tax=Gigaspora rosea TaxID=44941 RepID=A0A397UL17_9GLOM|nr:hypothetical protein C2G38_2207452 [Gigaspora rosea]